MRYKLVVAGGTFDHLHAGHRAFLRGMLAISDHILLGITTDAYVARYKAAGAGAESYVERKKRVLEFFEQEAAKTRINIEPINNLFYPAKWRILPLEAIIVTDDTLAGAQAINADRESKKLPPLEVVVLPMVTSAAGQKLSSTAIRTGTSDTEGMPYLPEPLGNRGLVLPEHERHLFQQPFGQLLATINALPPTDPDKLVTVGDVVTQDGNTHRLNQKLSVVDFYVQRQLKHQDIKDLGFSGDEIVLRATNPPGHIQPSLVTAIGDAVNLLDQKRRIVVLVDGEEDLAVIPLVLALPLGHVIIYGQPNKGVVRLTVTTETKDKAREFIEKFKPAH